MLSDQRLNISKDVTLLFFARSLAFQVIRHFQVPTLPTQEAKTSNTPRVSIQKSMGKMLLQVQKLDLL